ncbi:ABC transporter substrate-binding protein [Enterococcus sp. BWT-B8]|uniref:ABC transporter substrate-binding protein n=1 Tax=Enterococcus sp. BWT-B8 TaxID=2885157 RepID=UPI001E64DBA7|nr:ABC transporter substrate-binding protein [Enterococcus sp. BWT-B8]MCB5951982.1 ABC transporter substrate-binding protein [Enterococcus sp. BWT-B8]
MKKFFPAIFLLLFFLSACNSAVISDEEQQSLVIGFSQSGTESKWRKRHTDSIRTELEKNNQVLYRNGYMNQERQIQDIRTFIAYKVDMIVFTPLQEDGWEPVLKEAKQAAIPVIIVDRHINVSDQSLYVTHIGPSFKAEGNRGGLYVSNHFSTVEQPEINILELAGLPDTSPTTLRTDGFQETISRDNRMEVVDTLYGDYIRMKGKEQMEKYIEAHDISTIDVLYSHNDEMTHGALEALKKTDIVPGEDIVIVTIDAQEDMIEKLRAGEVNCVVECNPNAGWFVANAIERYFASDNKEDFVREIYMFETVFSETNLDKIPTRNY